ncbi:hypothetical protein [Aeromonas phage 51]|uniref:Uncharacterized protein n=3 Tax=Popoffvirus pv56 TaxID=2560283 RepID=A0A219YBA4_9CAUD|nr:hypothetical protein F394_gp61 [Aeromonas phage vB_AsaM-56]AFC22657.1 hypothetical protein AsaM-56_0061 [Aeromonas phage vB_AsaM-56]APU01286.1 hypothetical protein [Aeromonas phage 51]APU01370.1 hypothetical protein [Aeromonas phage 56]
MLKKMISMLSRKAEGKTIVITIGSPVVLKQEIVECSATVKEPAKRFIDLEALRQVGR